MKNLNAFTSGSLSWWEISNLGLLRKITMAIQLLIKCSANNYINYFQALNKNKSKRTFKYKKYVFSQRTTLVIKLLQFYQFQWVQSLSRLWLFVTQGLQHARPPCPSLTPAVYSNSCPLSQWDHPTISSSVDPFSSRLQSCPASGSFPELN